MAIQEHRCFSIVCDVCKESLRSEDGGTMHFDTEREAVDNAGYHDWHTTATSAVCYFDESDAAHDEAIQTAHAAAEPGHQCWLTVEAEAAAAQVAPQLQED